ncbi:hypothetical protein D3C72_1435320 [compost metagenome]
MAHVGAVGEVIRAVQARHQLVQKGGLVAGAPRHVEGGLVRVGQGTQVAPHEGIGVVPGDRHIAVAGGVVHHRFGQAAVLFERVVRLLQQLRDGMAGKQLGAGAAAGRFGGDGLGAVFAKGKRGRVVAVGPGAAWAIEAVRLVLRQQRLQVLGRDPFLAQADGHVFQGVPAGGRLGVGRDVRCVLVFHGLFRLGECGNYARSPNDIDLRHGNDIRLSFS